MQRLLKHPAPADGTAAVEYAVLLAIVAGVLILALSKLTAVLVGKMQALIASLGA